LDGKYYRIYALEAEWRRPDGHYFMARADGKRGILRYDEPHDQWTLESAYDGVDLFARPGVGMVTVCSANPSCCRGADRVLRTLQSPRRDSVRLDSRSRHGQPGIGCGLHSRRASEVSEL